ncbi:SGNH/GDSL hydrolase family protein [Thiothrix nivea]|uniref:Lipolytic protein G-D-S-L family n=1 Tax=Thiothrix nivea (strain ATCC 35100 / DSM 5205 / JP2) TaxID=870187 RepID=A0A656HKY1_THINJ|nr:GDSL-type esterase/lipase family protein [Thiothrix nivea]EIJ35980.1 lipolytic protein G-D-S-L family [Thiothrix nivea DSM 5205]
MKKVLAINVLVFVGIIVLLEGSARLAVSQNEVNPVFDDQSLRVRDRPFVETDEVRGFALKSGFKSDLYSINANGFRGGELPPDLGEKYVILALGESTTFGWGVDDQHTYPYLLNTHFQHDDVYIVNAGIPSYTSAQTLLYLKEILNKKEIDPRFALINILWNDVWYSTVKNWDPEILVHQRPPVWFGLMSKYSRLFNVIFMGLRSRELVNVVNEKAVQEYGHNLEKMILLCRDNNIKVAFVEPPFDADHVSEDGLNEFHTQYTKSFLIDTAKHYAEKMHEVAAKYGVAVIKHQFDLFGNLNHYDLFLDGMHPNPAGNNLMAKDVYDKLSPVIGYN